MHVSSIIRLLLLILVIGSAPAQADTRELLKHLTDPGDGWTAFTPGADTRMIFVSSSRGSDTNDGLSPQQPLKTISQGFAKLRDNHCDWLLLKRGDVWYEPIGGISANKLKNGRSLQQPTLIASYGSDGARPLLKLGAHGAGLSVAVNRPARVKNIALVGLHFYDEQGDPNSPEFVQERVKRGVGISWIAAGANLLVEDCRFEYLSGGAIQGKSPSREPLPEEVLRNVRIRRCVVDHAWSDSGHCQGFFLHKVDGLTLEQNVLDHNGYCEETDDLPTWFNHNVYITIECDQVTARGNIVARGSTTGIYCRTNGILEGNLCLDNSPSLNLGRIAKFRPGGVTGRVADNVVIDGLNRRSLRQGDIGGGPGIEVANVNYAGAVVERNIVIGSGAERSAAFALSSAGVGLHNVVVRNNIAYGWPSFIGWVGEPGKSLEKLRLSDNVVADNVFQLYDPAPVDKWAVRTRDTQDAGGFTFSGNTYYTLAADRVELRNKQRVTLQQWLDISQDKKGQVRKVIFVDPTRSAASWHGSLGKEATREAFLAEACQQEKSNWRQEYTAQAVIAYIRDGFRTRTD